MINFLALLAIAVYIAICIWGFKWYFHFQSLVRASKSSGFMRGVYSFILFIIFICIEIPFAIFFPAWVNSRLMIFEENTGTTAFMLLFGCLILAISLWKGKAYRPHDF